MTPVNCDMGEYFEEAVYVTMTQRGKAQSSSSTSHMSTISCILCFQCSSLLMCLANQWKMAQVLETQPPNVGNLDGIPEFLLRPEPGPAMEAIWEVNQLGYLSLHISLFPYLSLPFKQIKGISGKSPEY